MKQPRVLVEQWIGNVAAAWKCSCGKWRMELPAEDLGPQEKAALVYRAYTEHVQAMHAYATHLDIGSAAAEHADRA